MERIGQKLGVLILASLLTAATNYNLVEYRSPSLFTSNLYCDVDATASNQVINYRTATNLLVSFTPTETDPIYTNALATGVLFTNLSLVSSSSNYLTYASGVLSGCISNVPADPTNFVEKTGDTMTGALSINSVSNSIWITGTNSALHIGRDAYTDGNSSDSLAIGDGAFTHNAGGTAVGADAYSGVNGVAIGVQANGYNACAAVGYQANAYVHGASLGYSSRSYTYGTAVGDSAYGYQYGVAIGDHTRGYDYGVAVGRYANAISTNIAIGAYANSAGGYKSIAIGHELTNSVDNSIAMRGNMYLDGASQLNYRTNFGSGAWCNAGLQPLTYGDIHFTGTTYNITITNSGWTKLVCWYGTNTGSKAWSNPYSIGIIATNDYLTYTNACASHTKVSGSVSLIGTINRTYKMIMSKNDVTNTAVMVQTEANSSSRPVSLQTASTPKLFSGDKTYIYLQAPDGVEDVQILNAHISISN